MTFLAILAISVSCMNLFIGGVFLGSEWSNRGFFFYFGIIALVEGILGLLANIIKH